VPGNSPARGSRRDRLGAVSRVVSQGRRRGEAREPQREWSRFLDGKIIETSAPLRTFERLEASGEPLALERLRP
jgi:hypothetical protein